MPLASLSGLLTQLGFMAFLVILGFFVGRGFRPDIRSFANLLIYCITPVVNFGAILQIKFTPAYLLLPVIVLCCGAAVSSAAYFLSKFAKVKKQDDNLLSLAGASANSGYFGLPIIVALFPQEWVGVYLLGNIGLAIAESTFGYYYLARGKYTLRESVMRVFRLPVLYAVLLATLLSACGVVLPQTLLPVWANFKGTFVVVGMMLIGIAVAQQTHFHFDLRFIAKAFAFRHLGWALVIGSLIFVDARFLHLFPPTVHAMLALYPLLPLAANIVAFAIDLHADVGKATLTVLISHIVGIALVLAATFLGYFGYMQNL